MMIEIRSGFTASVLFTAEAENLKAALIEAVKARAHLPGADLPGADLQGAHLRGADLQGADLRGAKIHGDLTLKAVLQIGLVDDWPVLVCSTEAGIRLRVGCHFFTLDDAEAYWRDKPDRRALHYLAAEGWKALVRLAGWE